MSIYRVIIRETVTRYKEVKADSVQDAREIAEGMDWRRFILDPDGTTEAKITDVMFVDGGVKLPL